MDPARLGTPPPATERITPAIDRLASKIDRLANRPIELTVNVKTPDGGVVKTITKALKLNTGGLRTAVAAATPQNGSETGQTGNLDPAPAAIHKEFNAEKAGS